MTEPSSADSALKLALTGSASGLTYAVAAVQANPEVASVVAPDLKTSLYMLAFGVLLAAGKTYLPSEKKVDTQFQGVVSEVQSSHKTLTDRLEAFAFEASEQTKELRGHRIELATWIGGVDAKLDHISSRQDRMEKKLENI